MTKATKLVIGASIALASLTFPGCERDEEVSCEMFGAACVGAPGGELCGDDYCTEGANCSEVIEVENDADLQSAAGRAAAGSCIAVAPGDYGAVSLAGGVSLLGKGADAVRIRQLSYSGGSGSLVRGVEVQNGVTIDGTTGVQLDSIRVVGGSIGVDAKNGASIALAHTTISGTALYGIFADGSSVAMSQTIVQDTQGAGVWTQCAGDGGCACTDKPSLEINDSLVRRTKLVGVSVRGTRTSMHHVDIREIRDFNFSTQGGGFAASQCSELDLTGIHIENTDAFGVLISRSSGKLGGGLDEFGIIIVNSRVGCWLDAVGADGLQPLEVNGLDVDSVHGVGLGLGLESKGIIIVNSKIANTKLKTLPVMGGGSEDVGDALVWNEGVQADVQGITISSTARHPVLLDGNVGVGSKLTSLTLAGGDESKGILQQRAVVPGDAIVPEVDNGTSITQAPDIVAGVPVAPSVPPAAE
ncbi:MAG TPA: hypothetical protein VFB62_02285 [Polyangiaceae bacterium]|nr:hypothetical protein [Polyangiaceae bacterium]